MLKQASGLEHTRANIGEMIIAGEKGSIDTT